MDRQALATLSRESTSTLVPRLQQALSRDYGAPDVSDSSLGLESRAYTQRLRWATVGCVDVCCSVVFAHNKTLWSAFVHWTSFEAWNHTFHEQCQAYKVDLNPTSERTRCAFVKASLVALEKQAKYDPTPMKKLTSLTSRGTSNTRDTRTPLEAARCAGTKRREGERRSKTLRSSLFSANLLGQKASRGVEPAVSVLPEGRTETVLIHRYLRSAL